MSHKNGLENYYVIRGQKKLRFGYTTGSCAAGAAKAAVEMLLGGYRMSEISLMTPKGILLSLELEDVQMEKNMVSCAVRKDGGDDPDSTNGLLIYALAEKTNTIASINKNVDRYFLLPAFLILSPPYCICDYLL